MLGQTDNTKLMELLKDLEDSKTTLFAFHFNDPNVGMSLTKDISKYKIFCADTGLFVCPQLTACPAVLLSLSPYAQQGRNTALALLQAPYNSPEIRELQGT